MNLNPLPPDSSKPSKVIYSYIDGSGNTYYITRDTIQFNPITAKYSSSGFYDGGKTTKVILNQEQFEMIEVILQQVEQNTSDHILNRTKGSGKIHLYKKNKHFILAYKTSSQKELEALLDKIIAT